MKNIRKILSVIVCLCLAFSFGVGIVNAEYDINNDDIGEDIFAEPSTDEVLSTDFEDGDSGFLVANPLIDTKKSVLKTTANPLKNSINSSDTVLQYKPSKLSSSGLNNAVYTVSRNRLKEGESLYSVNFDLYLSYLGDNVGNYTYPTFVFDYVDENNWRGITFQNNRGTLNGRLVGMKSDATLSWDRTNIIDSSMGSGYSDFQYQNKTDTFDSLITENTWISVSVQYSKTDVTVTVKTKDGIMKLFCVAIDTFNGRQTLCGFTSGNADIYIDNLDINLVDKNNSADADNFKLKNSDIFDIRAYDLSTSDAVKLNNAIAEFEALSDEAKTYIPLYRDYLSELEARMSEISGKTEYSLDDKIIPDDYWEKNDKFVYKDNFDDASSLIKYVDVCDGVQMAKGPAPRIVESKITGSNVLELYRNMICIREELLPEKPQISNMSYDLYIETSELLAYDGIRVWLYYYNENNFAYMDIQNHPADESDIPVRYRIYKMTDGSQKMLKMTYEQCPIDIFKPIHFEYIFVGSTLDLIVSSADKVIAEESVATDKRGQFAFGAISNRHHQFYDNLEITFIKGDYDEDITVENIPVYFSGNTYQAPGDVVTINGENLGNVLLGAELMPIANTTPTDNKYYDYIGFDYSGTRSGTYSSDPADVVWNSAESVPLEILQLTENSVKFVIPRKNAQGNDMQNGIYAVKLYGQDGNADYVERILTLNTARIDYVVGNDGDHASPGGYFEIVGKNIAFPKDEENKDYSNIKAILKNKDGDKVTDLTVTEVFSDYNMRVGVPRDIEKGDYELWIYNGYSDAYGLPFDVKVDIDNRERILSGVRINVLDNIYTGTEITGVKEQNATANVQALLNVLYEQGGGVLYFPKGEYRFTQPLIIPQNVAVLGESLEDTVFIWTSFDWRFKHLPSYLLGISNNTVIDGISIHVHRTGGIISLFDTESENIYLSNIRTYVQNTSGTITSGGHSGQYYNSAELILMNACDNYGNTIFINDKCALTNYQVRNCEFVWYNQKANALGQRLAYHGNKTKYVQLYDTVYNCGWCPGTADYAIIRNVESEGAAFAITGTGVIYDDCYIHDDTINNRELFVADLGPSYTGLTVYPDDDPDTYATYILFSDENVIAENLTNMQLYVRIGQGSGQTRIVRSCEKLSDGTFKITFDTPFQVEPNRNSNCIARWSREHIYFVDSYWYNGSTVGFYGGVADAIFDGNTYDRVGNQYLWACFGDVDWYVTYKDDITVYDPFYATSDGTEGNSGFTRFRLYGSSNPEYVRCITFRNCDMAGRYLWLSTGTGNSIVDLVLDKTSFSKSEYAITHDTTAGTTALDGILLYGNSYSEIDSVYGNSNAELDDVTKIKNSVFDFRAVILDDTDIGYKLGDVNLDGKVNLKDCTYLRLYLVEKVELSELALSFADVNEDGTIDLRDCSAIRLMLLQT